MNKNKFWKKVLVFTVVALFLGLGVYPSIAVEPISSTKNIFEKEIEQYTLTDSKDFLFQTILDIADNPEVKGLLNLNEEDWKNDNLYISWNLDSKGLFQKLLFKKPTTLMSILFTEPSMTHNYLDFSYSIGCELIKVLGEEYVLDIINSAEINDPEIFDDLKTSLLNDEELSAKIATLEGMNEELDISRPFSNYSTICKILLVLYLVYLIRSIIVIYFHKFFEGNPIMLTIIDLLWFKNWMFAGICMLILRLIDDILGCEDPSPTLVTYTRKSIIN
jgi:hypothetical protein